MEKTKIPDTLNWQRRGFKSREAYCLYRQAWYEKNKDRIKDKQRAANFKYYHEHLAENRARGKEYSRRLWAENPDEMRAKMRIYTRQWRKAHPKRNGLLNWKCVLKKKYGLTEVSYNELLVKQNHVCAICKQPDSVGRLAVDHCHQTGIIRGLLCRNCNIALGKFQDSPEIIRRVLEYLSSSSLIHCYEMGKLDLACILLAIPGLGFLLTKDQQVTGGSIPATVEAEVRAKSTPV